jgi:hypothetical protein
VGQAAAGIAAFQTTYQGLAKFDLKAPNPNYVSTLLANGLNLPVGLFAPGYKTPRALQMNVGVEHELRQGTVPRGLLRNVTTRTWVLT